MSPSTDPPLPDPSEEPPAPRSSAPPTPARSGTRAKGAVSSGLANRRNPLLVAAGDAALIARRVLLGDPIKLFLGVVSAALAIAFFVLLGSIGPSSSGRQLPISRVITLADHKQVAAATLLDHDNRVEVRFVPGAAEFSQAEAAQAGAATAPDGTGVTDAPAVPVIEPTREYWAAYPASGAQT